MLLLTLNIETSINGAVKFEYLFESVSKNLMKNLPT